jgi:hypothetical protein
MEARAAAAEATRERILGTASDLFARARVPRQPGRALPDRLHRAEPGTYYGGGDAGYIDYLSHRHVAHQA